MIELVFALAVFLAVILILAVAVMDRTVGRSIDEIKEAIATIKQGLKKNTLIQRAITLKSFLTLSLN